MSNIKDTPADDLKREFNLKYFVETGCDTGNASAFITAIGFAPQNIYVCDIRQEAVDVTTKRVPGINAQVAESIPFLKNLLPTLKGPTLFWLDAHYPAEYGVSERPDTRVPILEEMFCIKAFKENYKNDVILCDDTRMFVDDNNRRYIPGEIPERLYVHGKWDAFTKIFRDTHIFLNLNIFDSGVGAFIPRKI